MTVHPVALDYLRAAAMRLPEADRLTLANELLAGVSDQTNRALVARVEFSAAAIKREMLRAELRKDTA